MSGCMNGVNSQGNWEYRDGKNWLIYENIILLRLILLRKILYYWDLRGFLLVVELCPPGLRDLLKFFEVKVKDKDKGAFSFSLFIQSNSAFICLGFCVRFDLNEVFHC